MIVFCLLSCLGAQRRAPHSGKKWWVSFCMNSFRKKKSPVNIWILEVKIPVDGQNPAPPRMVIIPLFIGFLTIPGDAISSINSTKDVWIATCFFWGSTLIGGPGLFLSWHWSRGSVIRCKVWMPRGWVFFTKDGLTWHLSGEKKRF